MVKFILTGGTDFDIQYFRKLKEYVNLNNLSVEFKGVVPYNDLKALYSACDIFVLPSFEEGDPMSLKEALASGKPLIASNVGGIPMQIKDEWNGFLVEPGNERQLAEKIMLLLDHREEIRKMGRNSRKLAEDEFDWNKVVKRYLKIYEVCK